MIHVLRKPLEQPTVAENVVEHGCGALNILETRVPIGEGEDENPQAARRRGFQKQAEREGIVGDMVAQPRSVRGWGNTHSIHPIPGEDKGRWPANLILDPIPAAALDQACPETVSKPATVRKTGQEGRATHHTFSMGEVVSEVSFDDRGGPSRFFKVLE